MTRNEPREIRTAQIIDAAVEEFVEKGYEGASMESIARRAKLTKGGLYHHFNSKDEILLEANSRYMEPVHLMRRRARSAKSPVRGLKTYIREYLAHWAVHPRELVFTFLSLAKALSTVEMWPVMEEYFEDTVGFYEALFTKGIENGEFAPHESRARAVALACALDGIAAYPVMCPSVKPEKTARQLIDVFIGEIEKK